MSPKKSNYCSYHGVMSKRKNTTPTPFSLRLTVEERAFLEERAGSMPLGAYIRKCLFENPAPRIKRKRVTKDQKQLAQILGFISATRIPNNLNQIAKAINTGSLIITEDVHRDINTACDDLEFIKKAITHALGFNDDGDFHDY